MAHPTTPVHTEVSLLLERLLPPVSHALGDELVAVYLWGSATLGGYVPGRSDVDLLLCLTSDPCSGTLEALAPVHAAILTDSPKWRNRLELAYVGVDSLASFRDTEHLILRTSPGEPLNLRTADHEWLIDWFQVRESGSTIVGPPAPQVLPYIAPDEMRSEAARQLQSRRMQALNGAGPGLLAYEVLLVARAAYAVEHVRQASKQDAGRWIGQVHPRWAPLTSEAINLHEGCRSPREASLLTCANVRAFTEAVATFARLGARAKQCTTPA